MQTTDITIYNSLQSINSWSSAVLGSVLRCPGNHPGFHEKDKSPVYGNRNWEIQKITESPFIDIFQEFGAVFYKNDDFRFPIQKKDLSKCLPFAEQKLDQFLLKYAPNNCTRENIVKKSTSGDNYIKHYRSSDTAFAEAISENACNDKYCILAPLAIIHESMHVEEMPYRRSPLGIIELFTSLKQHILTDEVAKECHAEIDDGLVFSIKGVNFRSGDFASFYRKLEAKHGSLSAALLSTQSIAYLLGGAQYESAVEIVRKYPGSKLAAKIAKKCLADKNQRAEIIALLVARQLVQKKQYDQAVKVIMKGLDAVDSNLKSELLEITRELIKQEQYEPAFQIFMKAVENSERGALRWYNNDFFKKGDYNSIFRIAMKGLDVSKDDSMRETCVSNAFDLILEKQYDLALQIVIKGLEDPARSVKSFSSYLAFEFLKCKQYESAFQVVMKSLSYLCDSTSKDVAKTLIREGYKTQDFLEWAQATLTSCDTSQEAKTFAQEILSEMIPPNSSSDI